MSYKCRKYVEKLKKRPCELCFTRTKIAKRFLYVGPDIIYESVAGLLYTGVALEKLKEKLNYFKVVCKPCYLTYYDKNKKVAPYKKQELIKWFKSYKTHCVCQKCGESSVATLDFHHLKDKKKEISKMIHGGYSRAEIIEEMKKCKVLCSNCHVKEHFGSSKLLLKGGIIKKLINGIKNKSSCLLCGETNPRCLQFHHRDRKRKAFSIGEAGKLKKNKEEVLKEVAKCDLLCGNCHREIHWRKPMVSL